MLSEVFIGVQNSVEKWKTYVNHTTILSGIFCRFPHILWKTFHNFGIGFPLLRKVFHIFG